MMTLEKSIRILDKALEYALYGLAFFIPVSIALCETFTIIAIVAFVLKKILNLRSSPGPAGNPSFFTPSNIFLLLFFIFCALSLVNSGPYLAKGVNALLGKWGKFIMLYWVAASSLGTGKRLRNITWVFLASAGLVVLDVYSQKFLGHEFLLHRQMIDVNFAGRVEFAVTGALKHSNNLATYLICVIPLLAAALTATFRTADDTQRAVGPTLYRTTLLAVVLLSIFCLVLTFSRGGWLGLMIAGGLMFFLLPGKKFFLILGAVFVVLILSFPGASERTAMSFHSGGDSGRFELWNGAWAMIAEHPFLGKGVGTFMAFFQDYVQGRGAMYAHNCYLQMLAETGILGLLSFLFFVSAVLLGGFRALRQHGGGAKNAILVGLMSGIVAFLTHSALDTNLYSLQLSALFWLFLGMIQALIAPQRPGL